MALLDKLSDAEKKILAERLVGHAVDAADVNGLLAGLTDDDVKRLQAQETHTQGEGYGNLDEPDTDAQEAADAARVVTTKGGAGRTPVKTPTPGALYTRAYKNKRKADAELKAAKTEARRQAAIAAFKLAEQQMKAARAAQAAAPKAGKPATAAPQQAAPAPQAARIARIRARAAQAATAQAAARATGSAAPTVLSTPPPQADSKTAEILIQDFEKGRTAWVEEQKLAALKAGHPDLKPIIIPKMIDPATYIPIKEKDFDLMDYQPRPEVMNLIEHFFIQRVNLMFVGPAGSGKSTIAKYLAMVKGLPYFSFSCDGVVSVKEIFGTHQLGDSTNFYVEGMFTAFTQIPSIILIDEFTSLDPGKNFIFHNILAQRQFYVKDANHTYSVHPKCFMVFAGNPFNPRYAGVNKMNLALGDRLGTIFLEQMTVDELKTLFHPYVDRGLVTQADFNFVMAYTGKVREYIKNSPAVKAEFSTRSIKRIFLFLSQKMPMRMAIDSGFINTYLSFDPRTFNALRDFTTGFVSNPTP